MEDLKTKNPYFSKYADKIAKVQKVTPEEFLESLQKIDAATKKPIIQEKERYNCVVINLIK